MYAYGLRYCLIILSRRMTRCFLRFFTIFIVLIYSGMIISYSFSFSVVVIRYGYLLLMRMKCVMLFGNVRFLVIIVEWYICSPCVFGLPTERIMRLLSSKIQ